MTKKKDISGNGAEGRRDLKTKSKVFLKFCGFKKYTAKADGGYRDKCQAFLEAMYGERLKPKSYWHKNPRGLPAALLTHILRSSAPDSTTVRPLSEEDVKSVFKKKYLQRKGDAKQTSRQEIDEASLEKIGLSRGKLIDFFKRMKVAGKGGSETVNVPPPSELVEAPYSSQQGAHAPSIGTTEQGPITVTPEQTQSEIGNRESAYSSLASGEDDTARDQDEGDDAGDATDDEFAPDPRGPTYETANARTPTSLDGANGAAVQEKASNWNPENAIIDPWTQPGVEEDKLAMQEKASDKTEGSSLPFDGIDDYILQVLSNPEIDVQLYNVLVQATEKVHRFIRARRKAILREFIVTDVLALGTGSSDESNTKPYEPTEADNDGYNCLPAIGGLFGRVASHVQ